MFALLQLFLAASPAPGVRARGFSQQPEDIYAWPKYKVSFLNGLPVLNHTAQRWLQDGLRGGEKEFLGLEWTTDSQSPPPNLKSIDAGDHQLDAMSTALLADVDHPNPSATPSPKLRHMRLDSSNEFLCLLLPPPEIPPYTDDTLQPPVPTRTWELLQPLQDTCIYHRQGWFTYAYCHNRYVRQFREKEPQLPLGIKEPQEDPNEDAYTLGHAPTTTVRTPDDPEAHVAVPNRAALASRLELARGAGHRYLIQRWGEGTVCDKTGKKREIEVQFHCSMTSTDSVFVIKETRTCQYTLVIHTPRLCGEPGFKSPRDDLEDTPIRCRKIVDSPAAIEAADHSLPESPYPWQRPKSTKPLPSPQRAAPPAGAGATGAATGATGATGATTGATVAGGTAGDKDPQAQGTDATQKFIKLAIEALLHRQEGDNARVQGEFGDLGVVTFGIDEHGLWMEKAKDATDGSDAAAAPGSGGDSSGGRDSEDTKDASGGGGGGGNGGGGNARAPRDKDASTGTDTDSNRVVHNDDRDRLLNEFEIEIREGEDARGLVDILRAAGYDVEVAKLGDDGKYTIQNLDDADDAETETPADADAEKGKKKRKHNSGDEL